MRLKGLVALFDGELDVLRVMIEPTNDDEILDASGDIETAAVKESQITGAQKPPLIRIGKPRAEDLPGFVGVLPVAAADAAAVHPNLTNMSVGTDGAGVRVDDDDGIFRDRTAAAHQISRRLVILRFRGQSCPQRAVIDLQRGCRDALGPAGNDERRLGEPVAWEERTSAKAARRKGLGKSLQCIG